MRPPPTADFGGHAVTPPDKATIATALRAQQVQMHGQNVPWATAGALALAGLLVRVQWRAVAHGPLLGWLAAVLLVLVWRTGLRASQRRGLVLQGGDAAWLRHYRANVLAHGLAWAAASALPLPVAAPMQVALLVIVLAGICASNFILNASDVYAALLFGVPTMGGLALHLLLSDDAVQQLMGLAVLLALVFFALIGVRAHRTVQENNRRRITETSQSHLLRVLLNTTREGFWYCDNRAISIDANPAMCQLLGMSRESLIGRSIYGFVDAANRRIVDRELALRAQGISSSDEITLQRSDGRRVDCYNQASPMVDSLGQRVGAVGLWTDISELKRAERQLRDTSEALRLKTLALEDALASISQGIVSYDGQGRLRAHNQRLLELLQLPTSLFHAQTRQVDVDAFASARGDMQPGHALLDASGQPMPMPANPAQLPERYVRRSPAGLLLEVRTRRMPDGGTVSTYADVTAYIQALRSLAAREREQRDMLEAFPGYIVVLDEGYRYSDVNQGFADLIGRPRAQIVGQTGAEVLGAQRFAALRTLLDSVTLDGPVNTESAYPATAWRAHTSLQVTHAISQDQVTGQRRVYAFAIDISARKAAEAAVAAARDEAERANRAKSQFLSSMSHELRTPLHAILGFGQLLATDNQHPLTAPQRQQMDEILRGGRHLLQLINEVLDLAVIESGSLPVHPQPLALAPVLADALAMLQPLASSRGIHLPLAADGLTADATVQADPVRLKQVLLNLLSNAIKYNRPQGRVMVHGQALALPGGAPGSAGWRITVQDTGPGLDAAQQARLFSAFDRLGASAGQVEGTGLGLALSRGLVQAMGGDIGVHSQPGVGSSFWLRLPAVPGTAGTAGVQHDQHGQGDPGDQAAARPAPPRPAASAALPLVLYIEDNPVNRMLMEAMFSQLPGLRLRMAGSAAEGMQLAVDDTPQLVLLDIQLPDMDGHALLRQMRRMPPLRQVPVIAVSADATPAAIQRGQANGFDAYLTKPLDLGQLRTAVQAALGRHG